jgi:hypothetical protein
LITAVRKPQIPGKYWHPQNAYNEIKRATNSMHTLHNFRKDEERK